MVRIGRLWTAVAASALALALAVSAAGCGGGAKPPVSEFAGHWTSTQWGEHYILVDGSTVKIVYDHDTGRVTGDLAGSTVTGWWTEAPSRQAPNDAGDVTFTLTGSGDTRRIDGTWRYSNQGPRRENWDLVWVGAEIPAEIAAKFADPAMFIHHP